MALSFPCFTKSIPESSIRRTSFVQCNAAPVSMVAHCFPSSLDCHFVLQSRAANYCSRFHGLKIWMLKKLNLQMSIKRKRGQGKKSTWLEIQGKDQCSDHLEMPFSLEGKTSEDTYETRIMMESVEETSVPNTQIAESSLPSHHPALSSDPSFPMGSPPSLQEISSYNSENQSGRVPSLCIAVIGATGELARHKVFPALFALYYNGFLPENVGIFGYSRKDITDEDLRSIIAGTLTCRVDHQENCGDKLDAFLNRTYYLNGECDNKEGMAKLNARMEQIEGNSEANRIFYLSVPQEALLDVASSIADNAQTQRGWNRIIIEKPFGFDAISSFQLTQSLLSKFKENQIYRIDHLLGKDLIENLTVLRFSNLVFEPLWSRTHIRNVQVILSEEQGIETRRRYFDGYGIIRDVVHSHILQTIALFAMEPPVSLDGEDIRNEKVKVLRSIRRLELDDIVLGQYKAHSTDNSDIYLDTLTPTFLASALYIDNARWDGVPFLIKAGIGLIKHRVEIRIQFHHVPGNLYRERIGHNIDLATNELILRGAPDEAILVKVNNKVPGLGLQLDASELNLLYKEKYNVEIPDSYEHLLLDVIDGDNHLFMRSDEVAAAWNILTPVLREMDEKKIAPELYQFGGRGPVGAYYLGAKHGVRWADD
ncbi:inactive glucose-6-phosphate 1-dehydrogenase 4, chloroplastic isoform X2 [Magnolia sinica]|uniref:inactive glucose-6-phosphate 1-dehydrogenase 4, chloroplastic isoform X2 n=1 Tax=Magnolia sinica TaxID=86752 RepID=UPI0026599B51|nr:inactive glucose-6-phosphate 1-dehydrogenase 4, chloroplastic isoform X2 [Magnolia sinica]